jgi:hypothetical protein
MKNRICYNSLNQEFIIGYWLFTELLGGLKKQTLVWTSRNDSQSHTKALGHQESHHFSISEEAMFWNQKLPIQFWLQNHKCLRSN